MAGLVLVNYNNNNVTEEEGEVLDNQHQNHCDKCFSPVRCMKYRSLHKNDPKIELSTCPIISCQNKCGWQFHECKKSEHDLLCEKAKVSCINRQFGCPMMLQRSNLSGHLTFCPASVVVCTMEWNRWPLPGKCQPFAMDQDHLDVCAAILDQQTIKQWKENIPSYLKNTLLTYMNQRHPVMQLGVSGHRIPKSIIDAKQLTNRDLLESPESESTTDDSLDSPWASRKPGLQDSVCYKLATALTFDNNNGGGGGSNNGSRRSSVRIVNEKWKRASRSADLLSCEPQLNLTVEIISKYQCKPNSMYSFICGREFRRDELAGHFKHFHTEIHTQLNGWLFQRCPMANLGCSFGIHRLFPHSQNNRIVFNQALSAFSHTTTHIVAPICKGDSDQLPASLLSLPFEILVHLTKFLDPLSLNSLAQVNLLFEDVCRDRLLHRGIVVLHWEKATDKPGWIVKEHKWMYTVSFSPITNWVIGNIGRMANHMKTCSSYDRNIPSRPFSYHTLDSPANSLMEQTCKKEL